MLGHLALVLYIYTAGLLQPYLLEKVGEDLLTPRGYQTELWRLQTPKCSETSCPPHFSYKDIGKLPSNLRDNYAIFQKIEAHLELYHGSRVFFENGGKINRYGYFNISVFEGTHHLLEERPSFITTLELSSCYQSLSLDEDEDQNVFHRDWDLKHTAIIDNRGGISVTLNHFNLENNQEIFKEWYRVFTKKEIQTNLIQSANLRKKIKIKWNNNYGLATRLVHYYISPGSKIKEEF